MQASPVPTVWLTFKEAAAYTKFAQITLRRAMKSGALRAFRLQRAVRFRQSDLDAWASANPIEARS
jgi:excisionase family DNA binding protein